MVKAITESLSTVVNNATNVANNERKIHTDKMIANGIGEREYILFDKNMINKTLLEQLDLFDMVKDGKHLDKDGKIKHDYVKRLKELKKNSTLYSSMSTIELLGYLTNMQYFKTACDLVDEDKSHFSSVILGSLIILSMKRDINPHISPKLKPILLSMMNDYDDEKERQLVAIFDKVKKNIKFDFIYQ